MEQLSNVLVSICCITYNHESYIKDTLDGFLMQKTFYPIEIIIHDDASTDRTKEIIKEYVTKYPNIFVPIFQTQNQWSKGIKPATAYVFPLVRGKYISFCEGDDYWIDPNKLQKQIDYLESNANTSMIFSNRFVENKNSFAPVSYQNRLYNTNDILAGFNPGLQSICFRKDAINFDDYKRLSKSINGDRLIPYLCSLSGKIRRLKDFTAVYRMTGMGIATSRPIEKVLEISMDDFWRFHETLGFPNNRMLTKGQMRYLSGILTKNMYRPLYVIKEIYRYITKYQKITLAKTFWCSWYLIVALFEKVINKVRIKIGIKTGWIPKMPKIA